MHACTISAEKRYSALRHLRTNNESGKDGQYRWFLIQYNPLLNDHGRVIRWYATGTEINDCVQAEERTRNENLALREQIDRDSMFEDIVGSSDALHKVLRQVRKVAPSDSTILILGETGAGKELVARAIHKRSNRADRAFIGVNCAAIPTSLIASELFGQEKGAFTGATQLRLGRFESANGGTIFLDEVGDLPPEVQIALLRVLKEREIERVGSDRPIPVDVRVLAATHRDLNALVAEGRFRQDLLYRLNVVPIEMPSFGGIIVMRDGMNALTVIDGVKAKLAEIKPSLPTGVEIIAGYDCSGLIHASIDTLQRDLLKEAVIVSLVIVVFLFHFRSAFVPILTLPIAVLASFIPMYYLHVTSNIMSLGGLALAIGVLVDTAIVMVENGYRHLAEAQKDGPIDEVQRRRILLDAAKQAAPAIFFSLIIIVVSFLPVFLLEAQEGRMFRPLAWTKTLAVGFSSLLAITLVPVLMLFFIRGKLRPEARNPLTRVTQAIYFPILRLCLRCRKTTLLLNLIFLIVTLPIAFKIGSQFMPPPFEGSSLYMPTALPGISITQASQLMQEQDRVIRSFPEVESVFSTVGRSESATDNAPLDMYDTTVMLKPREQWRAGMTYEKLIQEMDAKLQFPGLSNTWTMPVENRLDMELTGIKTPLGIKIQGPTLEASSKRARRCSASCPLFRACGLSSPSASAKAFT